MNAGKNPEKKESIWEFCGVAYSIGRGEKH